jgi:hypothetical protein
MRTFGIRVLVPHPNNDVRPGMAGENYELGRPVEITRNDLLVAESLVEEMHDDLIAGW